MRIRVKISSLLWLLVFIVIIANDCVFYYLPSTVYMSETNKLLIAVIAVVLYAFCMANTYCRSIISNRSGYLVSYIVSYITVIIIVTIYSLIKYRAEDVPAMMNNIIPYLLVLLYAPILVIENEHKEMIWKMLNLVYIIWTVLSLLQIFLYESAGLVIMEGFTNRWGNIEYRNGNMRLLHGMCFYNIMVLFNYFKMLESSDIKKGRLKHGIFFLLGLYIVLFVEQSRAMSIVMLVCIISMLIYRRLTAKGLVTNFIAIALLIIGSIATNYLGNLIASITSASINNSMRGYAVQYYLGTLLNNPLFGIGFTNDRTLLHGSLGMAYIDDVGIFGQMARMGLCALILLVPLLVRLYSIQKKMRINNSHRSDLVFLLFMYTLLTSGSLIIFDPQRIALLPIILATSEVEYSRFLQELTSQDGQI